MLSIRFLLKVSSPCTKDYQDRICKYELRFFSSIHPITSTWSPITLLTSSISSPILIFISVPLFSITSSTTPGFNPSRVASLKIHSSSLTIITTLYLPAIFISDSFFPLTFILFPIGCP
uniref:Uncharacterized protein ORF-c16_026 n=1 Tax=Saccharolobus solfataricus TaxID=2287 RepID=Q9UX57_SACSO|nr:hypothetical protein [Saccharolobus solfataricus P2]